MKRLRPLSWIAIAVILGGFLAAAWPPGGQAVPVVEARPLYDQIGGDSAAVSGSGCTDFQVSYVLTSEGTKGGGSLGAGGGTCRVTVHWDAPPVSATSVELYSLDVSGGPTCAVHIVSWEYGDELIDTLSCGALGFGFDFSGRHVTDFYFEWSGANTHVYADWIWQEGSPGVTATPTAPTPTATATFIPGVPCDPGVDTNLLCNGSFELAPGQATKDWEYHSASRVENNFADPTNGGLPYCGFKFATVSGEGITQRVFLPAGPLYFSFAIRRKANDGGVSYPQVEIMAADSVDIGRQWVVMDGKHGEHVSYSFAEYGWSRHEETHTFLVVDPGYYDVRFYNIDYLAGYTGDFLGTPFPVAESWLIQNDPDEAYQVDDVVLDSTGYHTYCPAGVGGPTATPNSLTRTPTPTGTRTPTPGGPTATPQGIGAWSNCDFEKGFTGWVTANRVLNQLAGGPVLPQFARLLGFDSTLTQGFHWNGGWFFFTAWIGPGSAGSISVVQNNSTTTWVLWSKNESTPAWKLVRIAAINLPPGDYRLVVRGNPFQPMDVDGMMPGANGYKYCGSPNGATPTPGATAYVTATPTKTPTSGPSPTLPTRTPTLAAATHTPNATWTPSRTPSGYEGTGTALAGSATALAGTATAQASITPASATPTPTPGTDATATALASITPGTSTPAATLTPPPPPTATTMPNPDPQPEPAPQADCTRPNNPFNLAGWMEYEVCVVLTWTLWNDENSGQVLNIQATLQVYEPMGTLNELGDARNQLQGEISRFDWANTGLQSGRLPDVTIFFPNSTPNGLLTGNFALTPDPGNDFAFVTTCGIETANVFGDAMSEGLCAAINWMIVTGILNWAQYFFDLAIWIGFLRYVWKLVTVVIPQIL